MLAVAPSLSSSSSPSPPRSRTPLPAAAAAALTATTASQDMFAIDLGDGAARGVSEKAAAGQNARGKIERDDDEQVDDGSLSLAVPPSPAPREAASPPNNGITLDPLPLESAGAEEGKAPGGEAASASALSASPTKTKTPNDVASPPPPLDLDDAECCVCLEEFDARDNPAASTRCGHRFHLQCCLSWAQRSGACPLCGAELELEEPGLDGLLPPRRLRRTSR